jgi:SRSO17 transposase
MKLPIVSYPKIVDDSLERFGFIFQSPEQRKHFCEYVTGLIVGNKATIQAINELFLNKNDQSALNKFVTQAKWDEFELNYRRVGLELERLYCRQASEQAGRLIIDDTMAHHTKCAMDGLAYLHDHNLGHNVWAHNVVTSYYVNRSDQFPVDFRLYAQFNEKYERKQLQKIALPITSKSALEHSRQYLVSLVSFHFRQQAKQTKTKLGADLVRQAVHWRLPFSIVLFDSWYLRRPLIEAIEAVNKDWLGACPQNRKVLFQGRWLQLQEYIRTIPSEAYRPYQIGKQLYWAFTKVLPMKSLQRRRVRIVASYPDAVKMDTTPNFYAANRKDWEPKRILTTYSDRWPTETFNEDAKGCLGFEDYQLRQWQGIRRHWYLDFVAYSLLGSQEPPGRSREAVRGQFASTGQRCRAVADELLGHFVYWTAQQLQQGGSPDSILQMLLA